MHRLGVGAGSFASGWIVLAGFVGCGGSSVSHAADDESVTGGNAGETPGDSGSSGTSGTVGVGGTAGPTGGKGGEAGEGSPTGGVSGSSSGTAGVGMGGTMMGGASGTGGRGAGAGGMGGSGGSGVSGAMGQLVNPSFETSNTSGWTVAPADALTNRYAYVQFPLGTVPAPHGTFELATWHMTDAFTVEIFQTVTGLEDGTYTFAGHFMRGAEFNELYLFARNCSETDPDPVPIPMTAADAFLTVSLTGIEVAGGSCEVGIHVDSNATNWMDADLFSLELE